MQRTSLIALWSIGLGLAVRIVSGPPLLVWAEAAALGPHRLAESDVLIGGAVVGHGAPAAATSCPDGCLWLTPSPPPTTPPSGPLPTPLPGTVTPPPEPTDTGPKCSSSEVWDEGAKKCYAIQAVGGKPTTCTPFGTWGSQNDLSTSTGDVSCVLPLQFFNEETGNYQDAGLRISGAVGCLNIERGYGSEAVALPRTLIGLQGDPFRLAVTGVITPTDLGLSFDTAGWYRTADDWSVTGRTLGEVVRGAGHAVFDLKGYLGYTYPDIRNLNVYLRFTANPDDTEWGFAGGTPPRDVVYMAAQGASAVRWFHFFSSSYPSAAAPWVKDGIGPSTTGDYLPAYAITARTPWTAELVYSWEEWTIEGGTYQKVKDAAPQVTRIFDAVSTVASYRVLDYAVWKEAAMSPGANANCDAATGYIAVPVIEAQSVLRP